jgi:oxygen-independent coproporphyrinogen III oxidase
MHYPASELVIDPMLIRKYDVSGPRYTSYPTVDRLVEAFGEPQLRQWLAKRNIGGFSQPLSLYVHLPFCENVCYYCACNKVVTRDYARSAKYIKYLEKELALLAPQVGEARAIQSMHWGGGTPTFLTRDEMSALMRAVESTFTRERKAEYSIEVDPRAAEPGRMAFLAGLGFERASLGVQDFDPGVQKAVHRLQSIETTRRVMNEARESGFRSLNLDLIYGLPKQTLDSFNRTIDEVLLLGPERIALYNYAHLPKLFKPQRRIAGSELPSAEQKLQLMTLAIGRLTRAGYLYIGMDHFAKPDDELAVAQTLGQLARSFQGYSTHSGDLLGLGMSAIGQVGPTYYQNAKELERYYAALDAGRLPVLRGLELTADDLARRAVIQALMCNFRLSIEAIELAHLVDFRKCFSVEMEALRQFADDGLIELGPEWIVVTPKGRLLVRSICMVFDRYLREARERASYSRVI